MFFWLENDVFNGYQEPLHELRIAGRPFFSGALLHGQAEKVG
jgi:hypothetical protein